MRPSGLALADRAPAGVRLISGPGRSHYERGNLLFRSAEPGGDVLVKIYRQRKSGWNDFWGNVSERWFEHKRGVDARRRRDTEAAGLVAWRAAGCDVPRLVERERPDWVGDHPFLAMEFVEGPTLHEALADAGRPLAERRRLVAQLARDHAHRHRSALERGDPLLVHEHAMSRHVLVSGGRLATFDLEHAWRPGFPLRTAIAFELSSTLRSLWTGDRPDTRYVDAFVEGYPDRDILLECCREFRSSSLRWRIYRGYEERRRGKFSKSEAMARLAASLGA